MTADATAAVEHQDSKHRDRQLWDFDAWARDVRQAQGVPHPDLRLRAGRGREHDGVHAFMNRWNDSLATVTDDVSRDWAATDLGDLGWSIGKHVGADHEGRVGPPGT